MNATIEKIPAKVAPKSQNVENQEYQQSLKKGWYKPVTPNQMDVWRSEEAALIKGWQDEASQQALTTLLQRYEPLFMKQVQRILAGRSVSDAHMNDLKQEARLAFIQAVTEFDFEAGTGLSALSQSLIRPRLLRYALDYRHGYRIGTGSGERKAFYAALARRAEKIAKGQAEQLDDEDIKNIEKHTGATRQSTQRAVSAIYATSASVDEAATLQTKDGRTDDVERSMSISSAMKELESFIDGLDDRQRLIYYRVKQGGGGEVTFAKIAKALDISVERVGQIRRDMLADMALHLKSKGIDASCLF